MDDKINILFSVVTNDIKEYEWIMKFLEKSNIEVAFSKEDEEEELIAIISYDITISALKISEIFFGIMRNCKASTISISRFQGIGIPKVETETVINLFDD